MLAARASENMNKKTLKPVVLLTWMVGVPGLMTPITLSAGQTPVIDHLDQTVPKSFLLASGLLSACLKDRSVI